ncbi:hypothetical protein [Paenibacillus sp. YPG26]|uniref:hypothetical protein n=1 Tax=Paenibacillus sp. YPG26 TaxID=2878915 RepID=UPI0020406143|nr:hypothetical protein [Paenibacillus sp. YPG26]USB33933.1 hypothetical protein LDO05_03685 [Paenibacillus sp. YPG26]
MVATAKRLELGKIENTVGYVLAYESLLKDEEFVSTCKAGTSDEATVEKRLRMSYEYFKEV